jgi:hypothetical protein
MLPAPARIAPPPSPKSKTSWTPAVPPPPVEGGVLGNVLADRRGVGEAVTVGDVLAVADADGDVVLVAVADEPSDGLAVVVAGTLAGLLLGTAVGEAEPVTDGVKMAGVVVEEVPEQAESTTQASMAETPQPTAVSRPPGVFPAMVVHTFMEPPGGSAGWQICFPIPAPENGFATEKCVASIDGTEMPMACSALEY